MNNRGQVLVLFIIMLPISLILGAWIVDSSYILYQKNMLDTINYDVLNSIKNVENIDKSKIEELILKNDEDIVNEEIIIDENITIKNYKNVSSLFGKIIGIEEYKITSEKSISYNTTKELLLEINSLNSYDNTNNYQVINNNVTYLEGLVFNNSTLTVKNFSFPDSFILNISFNCTNVSGNILEFNDFIISIKDNYLYLNGDVVTSIDISKNINLKIEKSNSFKIYIDEDLIKDVDITFTNTINDMVIGNGFVGKINFIKIYEG